jgi:O-antigen/teichoic acid export membrane protein
LRVRLARFDWRTARTVVSFGGWLTISRAGLMLYRAADPILLNRFATTVDVVTFHLASMPQRHLQPFMTAIAGPLTPVVAAMYAKGRMDQIVRTALCLGRYSAWLLSFPALCIVLYGSAFFRLYLRTRFDLYGMAPLLATIQVLPLPLAYTLYQGLDKAAVAMGRIRAYVAAILAGQVLHVLLTCVFVAGLGLGAPGASLAVFTSWILVVMFGYVPIALRLLGISLGQLLRASLVPGLLPAVMAGPVALLVRCIFPPATWPGLIWHVLFLLVVLGGAIVLVCESDDRRQMRSLLDWLGTVFRSGLRVGRRAGPRRGKTL